MIALICRTLCMVMLCAIGGIVWWYNNPDTVSAWIPMCGTIVILLLSRIATFVSLPPRLFCQTPPAPDISFRQAWRYVWMEYWSSLTSLYWYMPWHRVRPQSFLQDHHPAVLLIHGYACNNGIWTWLSRSLSKAHITHYAIDLEPVFGDIEEYASRIHAAIMRIQAETGQQHITVVAHSMGGIATRAYLRQYGTASIRRIITLGSPHHGTQMATAGYGKNSRQMRFGKNNNPWLDTLAASETASTRALFTSIYSLHDNIVMPAHTSILEDATNIPLSGIGHISLLYAKDMHALIIGHILRQG